MPVIGRSFGQERPPLTDLLKNILLKYPDGGQILKEIIQNADDAGAKEVKVLFDATSYGTASLVSPELALFQGPALYCYNNAEFTDEDWEGLQRLMKGSKQDNPLKVGRFGVGFNSVYHITDLPSIASGDTVAFLDPHEKYFVRGQPGQAFSTKDPLLTENFDQFEPFHQKMFECNLSQGKHYNGTLFRFPLRTQSSKLSDKIYTKDMIDTLFDSFKSEATAILLFLKSVDTISLYEREERGKISHLYTAKVSEKSKTEVRKRRQELIQDISLEWDFAVKTTFYRLEIEKECPGKPTEKSEWFLANQVGTNEMKLVELARNLKLLPWIGIALPVDSSNYMSSLGRIFCFLPLPPDCRTGLPVQMNGYFGLTDNRRTLKWPGPDCQNDETAQWNQLLLEKVGSQVYVNLIANITRENSCDLSSELRAKVVYTALPVYSHVREEWRCILQQFFRTVLTKEIFFTTATGNSRWITLGEAIIDRLEESDGMRKEVKQAVLHTLLSAGQPIVSLPAHVLQVIDQYHQISGWKTLYKVTPALLCHVLRSNFDFHKLEMPFQHRLFVLEYALQNVPGNISNLYNIPLLPLENRQFIKFSHPLVEKIFIPSVKHSADLLPNMKHRLLCRTLPLQLQQKLNELANSKATQLHHPTAHDIKQLLWQNLPNDWSCSNPPQQKTVSWNPEKNEHPSLAWLELVWKWINENFPRNLAEFEGMPLIPVETSSMARISQDSTIIVGKHPLCNETLTHLVHQLLIKSDCIVIKKLSSFAKHDQLFNYVALPNPLGILRILSVARKKVFQQLTLASNKVKEELCSILSRLEGIDLSQKSFIRTLPIFKALDASHFVSCQTERGEQRLVAPRNLLIPAEFRIIDQRNILSSSKDESYRLLQKLNMKIESTAGLIRSHLENFLNSGIRNAEKDNLVLWILKKLDVLNQEMSTFATFIRELACIRTTSGKRIAPNKLFDDSDKLLIRLLQDNNVAFPTNQFSEPIRRRKNELHVRLKENLTAQDVLVIVSQTHELSVDRGMALVELLNQRPQLLREYTGDGVLLCSFLREFPWFPRVVKPPANYPDFMPWYDGVTLCKPSSMQSNLFALLVGATVPVFDDRFMSRDVQELLGISQTPNVHTEVIEQLQLAIVSWRNQTKPTARLILAIFEELIKVLYTYLCEKPKDTVEGLLQSRGLTQWVWHGSGFTSPEKVALESNFPKRINVYPYLYLLPNELFKVKNFLLSLGVKPQFTVDDLLDMLWSIKAKHDEKTQEREVMMHDFDQCRAVLEWIVGSDGELSEEHRSKLLIPVQAKSDKLQLEPCNRCTFCDREFLRRGISEYGLSIKSYLVHKEIPENLASRLRVPRLSSCLAKTKAVGIKFKEAGQYEPLTTRLRNILQQYKEEVAIFKELVQNADDAGASKVCFVVDWRENPREKLLAEELSKCQGPALWAYNDAMFCESDFENINKLAGETKKEDLDKVGRFGLGFNSVYHLTDIPSFVSGEHIVIFDPNMNHISQLIDGKMRKGGLMLSLVENENVLSAFPDQFSPYDQLFGCNMTGTGTFHFGGTLFRLPFRTNEQARESEISQEPYTRDNVNKLIKSLKESASTLLLFSQNVKEVRVFEIRKNSTPKKSLGRPIFVITKSVEKTLYTNITEGTILQNASNWLKNRPSGAKASSDAPRRTELFKMNVSMVKSDLSDASELNQIEDTWLVNSCTGQGSSFQVAQSVDGKRNGVVPVTGTAAKITHSNVPCAQISSVTGEVFCFMPLSIESGFPVHVNGSFSVYSNRRRLWEESVGEHHSLGPFEAKWNEALMEDSLVQAYLQLLKMLTSYNDKQYEFHSLWPNPTKVNYPKAWKPLLDSFFSKIIDEEWPLFYCNGKWRKLQDCLILDPKLNKVADCVKIMNLLNQNVLSLPQHFVEAFISCGKAEFIKSHTLTEDKFLREFFFPKVSQIPNPLRNSVLVHILHRRLNKHRNYDDLLQTYPCFSCSKDGMLLRKPKELVHPKGKVGSLFSEEEKLFPSDARFLEKERAMMLEELGMVIDFLPWRTLCERAEWISKHNDVKRAGLLIEFMNHMPSDCKITEDEMTCLRSARILPILSKPKDYPFSWKRDEFRETLLGTAENLYLEAHKYLVGSCRPILDESSNCLGVPNKSLKKILGLTSKQPELSDVIVQLDFVIKSSYQLTTEKKEDVCSKIYLFLQKIITSEKCKSQLSYLREQLQCRSWMLVRDQMVDPKLVAKNWNKEDGSPYLFRLPVVYSTKFKDLVRWYKVKDKFSRKDFIEAIVQLRQNIGREKMLDDQIHTLIVLLEEVFRSSNTKPEMSLPLPGVDGQLHDADTLVINKTPWLETDSVNNLVHEKVPILLAYKCGAKDLRNADLTNCSEPISQSFGQDEKLTTRLKNILSAYPADVGILKELLQNADDAEANEIHFVFDPRTHNSERIFSDNWKDLQGPAICIYNDKPFSKEDIEGIQKLGIGSKLDDPLKTGQYGIGFNAVYHLTDCPYFISNDEVICVFDPHIAYVPGATEDKPGRLFPNLDKKFRRNYQDVLSGFLGDHFQLEGSTVFRFPLRRASKSQPDISTVKWDEGKVKKLLGSFRESAKQMLLFLNNVTKISISEIKNGELETYSVMSNVSDNGKRAEFFEKVRACSNEPTRQIQRHQIHYVLKIHDTKNMEMDWLVTQSLGYDNQERESQVPNGTEIGLLPLAGIAVCLSSTESARSPLQHSIFCVLPLPISTKLPAHINGHFALNSSRRCLWHDCHKPSDKRIVWNDFMKRQVVAPAYARTIFLARDYIPDYRAKSDTSGTFPSRKRTENGLKWYHQLFPCIADLDEVWKPVGKMLYKYFLPMLPVLPVAMSVPEWKNYLTDGLSFFNGEPEPNDKPVNVTWCKVGDAYFCTNKMSWLLEKTLLEIGFRLLSHTPEHVHKSFYATEFCQDVNPDQVKVFLCEHREMKDRLPTKIKGSVLHDVHNVCELTAYCAKAKDFFKNLEGLPLLLTQDGILRCFHHDSLVFFSKFSQLLPSRQDLFIHDLLEDFYASNVEKCSEVVREFLVPDLAKFQDGIFPLSWITDTASHQPWNPDEQDNTFPSKEWLKLLWKFIDSISKSESDVKSSSKSENKTSNILKEIFTWHIIPTTHNCLVPVSMGKTVLDVSTFFKSDSSQDETRRKLLDKIGCPHLDHTFLDSSFPSFSGATAVRKQCLAMIQSTKDVLHLLDKAVNGDAKKEAMLENFEIEQLFMFLQSDLAGLSRSVLRSLPFYETISHTYTRLSACNNVYEVPVSVPDNDLEVLSKETRIVFLCHAPKVTDLYRHIGINQVSSAEFYRDVILKYFDYLTPEGREKHLEHVKNNLLNFHDDGYKRVLDTLKYLSFIPDHEGKFHPVRDFYDADNEVFTCFLTKEKFPPEPFDSTEWKEFLKKVGLQCTITKDLFKQFSKQLEEEARNSPCATTDEAKEILQKSNILVSHLLENKSLHAKEFLSQISKINFVPAAIIEKSYLEIHPLHMKSILTCFSGSVVGTHKLLVWSSSSLVEASAVLNRPKDVIKKLGIHLSPPHKLVILHTQNISSRFYARKEEQISSKLKPKLSEVMTAVYSYFSQSCDIKSGPPNAKCSVNCKLTQKDLQNVPVILLDQHTLLRGSQVAFNGVWDTIKPYMFNIPRHLQHFEHFLKCLGAQEHPTPLQCSSVLEAIQKSCGNNRMHPKDITAAGDAAKCLFISLSKEMKKRRPNAAHSLKSVRILYLPTADNYLMPSSEVFFNDNMEKEGRLQDYSKVLLIDLTMKDQEPPAKLVELLPNHLKVKTLSSNINEKLSESYINNTCNLDKDPIVSSCEFIKRYRDIICSREFSDALIRLYKFQEDKKVKIPMQVENDLRSLENGVKISCMQTIDVQLVTKATMEPIPGSMSGVSAFCEERDGKFVILIKHGGDRNGGVLHDKLCSFISRITGRHISEAKWRYLIMILGVKDPWEISKILNDAGVPRSSEESINPGDRIPKHSHLLLKHDIYYNLQADEWVGFETREENEENDAVYLYAKIIKQTSPGDGRFAFNSKYMIDIGVKVEVSKLKLYKFHHKDQSVEAAAANSTTEGMQQEPSQANPTPEDGSPAEPAVLKNAKEEVAEALREIRDLADAERCGAVRRLIRRWHPDRQGPEKSFAIDVTRFLLHEVERLNQNERADNYQVSVDSSRAPENSEYFHEQPNRNKAKRWMRQAQIDYDAAKYLFQSHNEAYYSFTCFHCQQAVEKALKALMFAEGLIERDDLEAHDVLGLAYRAQDVNPSLGDIASKVEIIHTYYSKTRYPNCYDNENSIPAERFTIEKAQDALSIARETLKLLREEMEKPNAEFVP